MTALTALDTQGLVLDRFWRLARRGTLAAIVVHALFALAGWWMQATPLVIMQAIAVGTYGVSYAFSSHRYRWFAISLAWADLLIHAKIAAWILGAESGFQFYSWILLPLVFTNVYRSLTGKTVVAVALCVSYVAVDWWLRHTEPVVRIDPFALELVRYFNLTCYLLALGVMAVVHGRTVGSVEQRLNSLASTDMLTGLLNRRRMTERMQRELQAARSSQQPFSVLLLDIDHFKSINDEFGHVRGDQVIAAVGEVLRAYVRREDSVSRWGGEEFLIMQPNADLHAARDTAERIRQAVRTCVVRDESDTKAVTLTIGLTVWRSGESLEEIIHRADQALYMGKRAGRDRVIVADSQESEREYWQQSA